MKRAIIAASLLLVIAAAAIGAAELENGVTIETQRVFHGASTGARYYGWTGGVVTLPSKNGGVLSFNLWNDIPLNGTSCLNYFRSDIGGKRILVPSYTTANQIVEPYAEDRAWGAGGVQRISIGIPAGVGSIQFDAPQSQTGIELSDLRFAEGAAVPPGTFAAEVVRDLGAPVLEVGRIIVGKTTGKKFYGYSSGVIHLPSMAGGFLSFKFWNDQRVGQSWTLNKLNLSAGGRKEIFSQYTTSLDLKEVYKDAEDHGPAGGGTITIQLPEGISRVEFNNEGSMMGLEITDPVYAKGSPVIMSFKEEINATDRVLVDLGRIFTGATTGRKYYGYDGGTIILPSLAGGTLTFRLWNDHPTGTLAIGNTLILKAGSASQSYQSVSLIQDRPELYNEDKGWGPAGGAEFTFRVPVGAGFIQVSRGMSQTGIELSDLWFAPGR